MRVNQGPKLKENIFLDDSETTTKNVVIITILLL